MVAALAGCATQAPLRDNTPGTTPVAGTDEDELWYAMERAERELQLSPQLVRDKALTDYVRKVACDAAADYCKDLRVYVMDVPQFNASMAPNGTMLVWTGALLRMRDEAELAFVLGHEAGHFRAQHSLRQWRRMKDTSAFLSAFQMIAYGAGIPDAAMLGELAGYAAIFKYSRDMEREADQPRLRLRGRRGLRPASRRRPVGAHAARGEHAALRVSQHRVRLPPRHPGTHQRRARRRNRAAKSRHAKGIATNTAPPRAPTWSTGWNRSSRNDVMRVRCWSSANCSPMRPLPIAAC